jgi:adenylate cyclase
MAQGYLGVSNAFATNFNAALEHVDEAIRLSPRDPLLLIFPLAKGLAALNAERYEEAAEYATQATEANPEFPDIYAVLASADGHLSRAGPARAALDQLQQRMPSLTASDGRLDRPFARAADRDRFLEGLRKAGMPAGRNFGDFGAFVPLYSRSRVSSILPYGAIAACGSRHGGSGLSSRRGGSR